MVCEYKRWNNKTTIYRALLKKRLRLLSLGIKQAVVPIVQRGFIAFLYKFDVAQAQHLVEQALSL